MNTNPFALLFNDEEDMLIPKEPIPKEPISKEPIVYRPTTPPFYDGPPAIQKTLPKISIKNTRPYSFYDAGAPKPIHPTIYAIVDEPVDKAPPSSPVATYQHELPLITLADRLRSTLQKEELKRTTHQFESPRTFEMNTVIPAQRFNRLTPLRDFRTLEHLNPVAKQ
jgi:hypothetical protein